MNTPAGGLAWPHDTAAVAVLDSVAARLQADPDAMVEAALTTVPTEADVLRGETRLLAGQLTDLLRHRRALTPGEVERIEALGAVRAARGLPLDELQRAARTAMGAAWRHLVGLVPVAPDSVPAVGAIARLAEEVFDFVQQASEAMLRGHVTHHRLGALQRDEDGDALRHLFDGAGQLARGATTLGLDLSVPHGLVLFTTVDGDEGDDGEELRLQALLSAFADRVPASVMAMMRTEPVAHAVIGVAAPTPDTWAAAMAAAEEAARPGGVVPLAVGPTRGAGGLFGCYGDATALLPVVRRVGPVAAVQRPDDLGIYRFLASVGPDEARAFVHSVLGPLLDLPQPERGAALQRLATLPTDDDDGLARIRLDTALALLRRYPDLDGACLGTGPHMDERTVDTDADALEGPAPAPEGDLADEGGPTQAGAERGETPTPAPLPGTDRPDQAG